MIEHMENDDTAVHKLSDDSRKTTIPVELAVVDKRSCIRIAIANALRLSMCVDVITTDNADSLQNTSFGTSPSFTQLIIMGNGAMDRGQTISEIKKLVEYFPNVKQTILTDSLDSVSYSELSELGVAGIFPSHYSIQQLAICLNVVAEGLTYFPPDVVEKSQVSFYNPDVDVNRIDNILTPRQRQIMDFIAIGRSNKFIAGELSLSESTVKIHVHNMMKHLGATNRTHATHIITKLKRLTAEGHSQATP